MDGGRPIEAGFEISEKEGDVIEESICIAEELLWVNRGVS